MKNTLQTTSPFSLRRAVKKLPAILSLLLISDGLMAQTSYYSNADGITGYNNSGFGQSSLFFNSSGLGNSANGYYALYRNLDGSYNTANGTYSLFFNTNGSYNTANGFESLYNNNAYYNTATGYQSLYSNTLGGDNTANGYGALYSNTTGGQNTATGWQALYYNNGSYNTANGFGALGINTSGQHNTACGNSALSSNGTGSYNTACGTSAAVSNTSGSYNTAIGYGAGNSSGSVSNTTALGRGAVTTASNQIRVGNTSVTSIGGKVGWSVFSDKRIKKDIQEKVPGLAFINKLRPVTYHLDMDAMAGFLKTPDNMRVKSEEAEAANLLHTGLIAQEVEKAATDLGYDFSGVDKPKNDNDIYALRYAEFTLPLIKAVQELSKQNEEQQKELQELKALIKNGTSTGSININEISGQTLLYQNEPNPFNQSTAIKYSIPSGAQKAMITIVSINGEKMKEFDLIGSNRQAVEINGGELAAGIYIYSLIVDGKVIDSKKMTLTQ